MSVGVGDPGRHRPASDLVERAFRSFAEDRARDSEAGRDGPASDARETIPREDERAKDSGRRAT